MLRRAAAVLSLLALISAPAIARERMVCRFSGLEVHCSESQVPGAPVVADDGCCDRQWTRPLGAMRGHGITEVAPPSPRLLLAAAPLALARTPVAVRLERAAPAPGPPLFLRIRTLLI